MAAAAASALVAALANAEKANELLALRVTLAENQTEALRVALRDLLAAIDLIDGTGAHLDEEELASARALVGG